MIAAVLGIACLVCLAVWTFYKLSPTRREQIQVWGWGAAGVVSIFASGECFYTAYSFLKFEKSEVGRMITENSGTTHAKFFLAAAGIVFLAVSLWSFRRLYRTFVFPKTPTR